MSIFKKIKKQWHEKPLDKNGITYAGGLMFDFQGNVSEKLKAKPGVVIYDENNQKATIEKPKVSTNSKIGNFSIIFFDH